MMYNLLIIVLLLLTIGALLRRSSLDPETRRLSLGTISNSRKNSDSFLDPTHAAILFRDSRGVSLKYIQTLIFSRVYVIFIIRIFLQLPVADPFLEKVKIKDLGK